MKKILFLSILLFSVQFVLAQKSNLSKHHPFSGTLVFSVETGPTFASTDYSGIGFDYFGKATVEYFLQSSSRSSFGIRLIGGAGFISGDDSQISPSEFRSGIGMLGGGVVYMLRYKNDIYPYISVGVNKLSFNPIGLDGNSLPNISAGKYSTNEANYFGELGARYLVTENLTVNFSAGINISPKDNLDDLSFGVGNDLFFTTAVGLSFIFLGESDSDGDGVPDSEDACPNTKAGILVDEFGCDLDSDGDKIPDHSDLCPNTPKNVRVDSNGCPLDSDRDGIVDYKDLCPDTPIGIKVDEYGCPYDMDADGIPDYLDKCPETPYGIDVDKKGCPVDSDLDGVPDHLDQCPDTPAGTIVDPSGCTKIIVPVAPKIEISKTDIDSSGDIVQMIINSDAAFDSSNTILSVTAQAELQKIILVMKKYPLSRWEVAVHTDSLGLPEGSLELIQTRADEVLNYFSSNGIPKSRIKAIGYGKKVSIKNKIEYTIFQNRNIIITRTDK